jgi:putative SOS response-associated peptidase YedK
MCGRYAIVLAGDGTLQRRFALEELLDDPAPRFNVAPTQTLPVITRNSPNRAEMMRWGFVPSWAKDASIGSKMINARAETVAEKPAFRRSLRARRCLVPATGFFE